MKHNKEYSTIVQIIYFWIIRSNLKSYGFEWAKNPNNIDKLADNMSNGSIPDIDLLKKSYFTLVMAGILDSLTNNQVLQQIFLDNKLKYEDFIQKADTAAVNSLIKKQITKETFQNYMIKQGGFKKAISGESIKPSGEQSLIKFAMSDSDIMNVLIWYIENINSPFEPNSLKSLIDFTSVGDTLKRSLLVKYIDKYGIIDGESEVRLAEVAIKKHSMWRILESYFNDNKQGRFSSNMAQINIIRMASKYPQIRNLLNWRMCITDRDYMSKSDFMSEDSLILLIKIAKTNSRMGGILSGYLEHVSNPKLGEAAENLLIEDSFYNETIFNILNRLIIKYEFRYNSTKIKMVKFSDKNQKMKKLMENYLNIHKTEITDFQILKKTYLDDYAKNLSGFVQNIRGTR